jgi:DNA-binding beta-propeller fold protein YncE
MVAALALPGELMAQGNFVYTDDDIRGANTVSAFSVASNGALKLVPGSPFLTGGTGNGGGWYGANRAAVSPVGNFLFVSNSVSNDVSVFTINPKTGVLKLVEGSPFATGGSSGGAGIALSPTPNGMFLMAGNCSPSNVTVFRIGSTGTLTPIKGSPFHSLGCADGIMVSPNGKFLAVGEDGAFQVEMFSIARDGSLTSLGVTPTSGGAGAAGVDIKCTSKTLYLGEFGSGGTNVEAFSISSKGALTPVPGSPFASEGGSERDVVLLGRIPGEMRIFVDNQKLLFVSNEISDTITVFTVASNGSLTLVDGSPFAMHTGAEEPAGMATSWDGSLLYVANWTGRVSVFRVAKNGALTEVAGSPFATGQASGMHALTAFPQRTIPWLFAYFGLCP